MKFGVIIPNLADYFNPIQVAELAQDAEKFGWQGFFLWDTMLCYDDKHVPINDPWVTLAAIAAKTKRIRLGPAVTPVPRRRPWKLARESVSLDHLSNGRLILGVGLGFAPHIELEPFGEEPDAKLRAKKLDEGLAILTRLWSGVPFSYTGEYFNLSQIVFLPRPVQQPRIPIWVAGTWPNMAPFRRAAQWDGVFPGRADGEMTPENLREILTQINQFRANLAHFDIVLSGTTPGDDPVKGIEKIEPFIELGMTWWLESTSDLTISLEEMRERIKQGPPKSPKFG